MATPTLCTVHPNFPAWSTLSFHFQGKKKAYAIPIIVLWLFILCTNWIISKTHTRCSKEVNLRKIHRQAPTPFTKANQSADICSKPILFQPTYRARKLSLHNATFVVPKSWQVFESKESLWDACFVLFFVRGFYLNPTDLNRSSVSFNFFHFLQ